MDDKGQRIVGILIRPKYPPIEDIKNHYSLVSNTLHQWAEDLFLHIKKNQLIDISSNDSNRENVEDILASNKETPVLFYGHGDAFDHLLLGYNNKAILDTENNELFKGRNLLIIACCSENFANDCIAKGALSYIGYNGDDLYIPIVEDELIQKYFKAPNNCAALMIIDNNHSVHEIFNKMINVYDNLISKLYNSKNSAHSRLSLFLEANLDKLILRV